MKKKLICDTIQYGVKTKTWKIMRLSAFFLFLFLSQVWAGAGYSQQTKLSLKMKDARIIEVLDKIEDNSEFYFLFNQKLIDVDRKVDVDVNKKTVHKILNELFEDTEVEYLIKDRQIVLTTYKTTESVSQQRSIKGKVTDEQGEPLPGVTVLIKGTTNGTVTNVDGYYSLGAQIGDILVFSFVGMLTQEVSYDNQSLLDITMTIDAIGIEEVVTIGYGVRKKATVTGAMSQVDTRLIKNRSVNKLTDALQGAIPGMTVTRNSGQPGDENYNIKIRGITSVNTSGGTNIGPLVLIDGVEGNINDVAPQDIESFNVLKDGAASIYGSRAAGGVILIETKRGRNQKAKIEVNYSQTYKKPTYIPRKANPFQYYTVFNEFKTESNQTPLYTEENTFQYLDDPNAYVLVQGNKSNFWPERTGLTYRGPMEDIFWDNGKQNLYNINTGGGTEKVSYYLSGSLLDEEGILAYGPDDFKKLNIRFNVDTKLSEKFKIKASVGALYSKKEASPQVSSAVNNFYGTYVNSPVWNEQGDFYSPRRVQNPIQQLEQSGLTKTDHYKFSGNLTFIYDILKGLQFEGKASMTADFYNTKTNHKTYDMLGWNSQVMSINNNPNSRRRDYNQYIASTVYGLLRYNKTIENHSFGIMVGANHDEWDRDGFGAWRRNISVQEPFTLNTGNPDEQFNSDWGAQWAIRSYFGRMDYSFKDRYIAEFTFRRDGTSRFHPDHRWGNFKSGLFAWRISEESWFPESTWFDYAKLRLSYGESGNQNNIGLYDYVSDININNNPVVFGTDATIYPSANEGAMVSLEREWETVITYNIGVDLTFFNSLQTSFDYYNKYNDDLLLSSEYPNVLGASPPKTNLGKLKTWGWDFSIGYDKQKGDFGYNLKFVLSDSQNELQDYGGKSIRKAGPGNLIEGYPVNAIFAYQYEGIMNTQEEADLMMEMENVPQNLGPGDIKITDLDGDGKYTPNGNPEEGTSGDLKYVGSPYPRFNFGFSSGFNYKNFDLSVFVQGVGKRTVYRNDAWTIPLKSTWMAAPEYFFGKTWTEENQTAIYPSLDRRVQGWNWQASALRIENGAYVRLKNVELGYSLPKKWVNRAGFDKIRFYASGQDIWEYHNFDRGPDVDPEHGATFFYPLTKGYSFGINVTF